MGKSIGSFDICTRLGDELLLFFLFGLVLDAVLGLLGSFLLSLDSLSIFLNTEFVLTIADLACLFSVSTVFGSGFSIFWACDEDGKANGLLTVFCLCKVKTGGANGSTSTIGLRLEFIFILVASRPSTFRTRFQLALISISLFLNSDGINSRPVLTQTS